MHAKLFCFSMYKNHHGGQKLNICHNSLFFYLRCNFSYLRSGLNSFMPLQS